MSKEQNIICSRGFFDVTAVFFRFINYKMAKSQDKCKFGSFVSELFLRQCIVVDTSKCFLRPWGIGEGVSLHIVWFMSHEVFLH